MKKVNFSPKLAVIHLFILLGLVVALVFPATSVRAATFTAGTEAELNNAINSANGNSEADTIIITANITLSGALPGITSQITIEGNGYTIDINNNERMVALSNAGNLTINNLTVTNGNNTGTNGGGAIFNYGGTLTVNSCTFSNNSASADGGAILNTGTLTVSNSTFTNNSAGTNGGAIYNNGGTVTIDSSTFSENVAAIYGGAVANRYSGTVTVNTSTFSQNQTTSTTAAHGGGGIFNDASLTVNDSVFTGNSALVPGGSGGGVENYNNSAASSVNNSTFSGNSADWGGAVLNNANSNPLTLNNCTITGNSANTDGGGVRNNRTLNLNRVIISGNSASGGAEIRNTGTINANNYNVFSHSGLTTAQAFSGFAPGASDYNASSDGNNIALASILNTTLADNGGPTQSHALVTGSPAIDYAPSTACTSAPINGIDQRGAARNYDGDGQGSTGNECDSGAYEVRESITQGTCNTGPLLGGAQNFSFTTSGNLLTVNVTSNTDLRCITIEEMGPGVDHLLATGPGTGGSVALLTNNWWHISGDGNSFSVNITLPYVSADSNSRVCKYPGGLGGYGWDCDDGTNTTYVANTSVTRNGITSFSDWAVGDNVGPTVVTLADFQVQSTTPATGALLTLSLIFTGGLAALYLRRKSNH